MLRICVRRMCAKDVAAVGSASIDAHTAASDAPKGTTSSNSGKSLTAKDTTTTAPARLQYKMKKKSPWGDQQLRDAWSVDAMTRYDNDSVGERLKREYRYHPDEPVRQLLGKSIVLFYVCFFLGCLLYHRYLAGGWVWNTFDFQFILDKFREHDTSPRSTRYRVSALYVSPEDDAR